MIVIMLPYSSEKHLSKPSWTVERPSTTPHPSQNYSEKKNRESQFIILIWAQLSYFIIIHNKFIQINITVFCIIYFSLLTLIIILVKYK